mmetsp:Transcript_28714/g.71547  ORF Transcript_28714/g.71547 Transcript_28714/m.71547 type:complete len:211 (+) Transcript_28714:303-935(+)
MRDRSAPSASLLLLGRLGGDEVEVDAQQPEGREDNAHHLAVERDDGVVAEEGDARVVQVDECHHHGECHVGHVQHVTVGQWELQRVDCRNSSHQVRGGGLALQEEADPRVVFRRALLDRRERSHPRVEEGGRVVVSHHLLTRENGETKEGEHPVDDVERGDGEEPLDRDGGVHARRDAAENQPHLGGEEVVALEGHHDLQAGGVEDRQQC